MCWRVEGVWGPIWSVLYKIFKYTVLIMNWGWIWQNIQMLHLQVASKSLERPKTITAKIRQLWYKKWKPHALWSKLWLLFLFASCLFKTFLTKQYCKLNIQDSACLCFLNASSFLPNFSFKFLTDIFLKVTSCKGMLFVGSMWHDWQQAGALRGNWIGKLPQGLSFQGAS